MTKLPAPLDGPGRALITHYTPPDRACETCDVRWYSKKGGGIECWNCGGPSVIVNTVYHAMMDVAQSFAESGVPPGIFPVHTLA